METTKKQGERESGFSFETDPFWKVSSFSFVKEAAAAAASAEEEPPQQKQHQFQQQQRSAASRAGAPAAQARAPPEAWSPRAWRPSRATAAAAGSPSRPPRRRQEHSGCPGRLQRSPGSCSCSREAAQRKEEEARPGRRPRPWRRRRPQRSGPAASSCLCARASPGAPSRSRWPAHPAAGPCCARARARWGRTVFFFEAENNEKR